MLQFQLSSNGLFLASPDAEARVAFVSSTADPGFDSFELCNAWWNALGYSGYFVFFQPSATRDWGAFADSVRSVFANATQSNPQLGWVSEDGAAAIQLVSVSRGGQAPSVQGVATLPFRNVSFEIQGAPGFLSVWVTYDDAADNFVFANQALGNVTAILLSVRPTPTVNSFTYNAVSASMVLPMSGAGVGCVCADFALAETDLARFEAGLMYFADPPSEGAPLTALSYPVVRALGGATTPLLLGACLDVLTPVYVPGGGALVPRSFFLFKDPAVGSYFVENPGTGAFNFDTVSAATAQALGTFPGCLVFANRPYAKTSDQSYYYLTPAGMFELATGAAQATAALVCGVSGTELFIVGLGAGGSTADSLNFVPGNAAYQLPPPPPNTPPVSQWLDSVGGNVTTSWSEWVTQAVAQTNAGIYIAQPNQAPLYQQSNGGTSSASGLTVYLLEFQELPAWSTATSTVPPVNGSYPSPAVPLAPYAGLSAATSAAPFLQMESAALAPTRGNAFAGAVKSSSSAARAAGATSLEFSMTPQGLLAGFAAGSNDWSTLQVATSGADNILEFTSLGVATQQALQQSQIFLVATTDANGALFTFAGNAASATISDWIFNLELTGTARSSGVPILILKFFDGQSIATLAADLQKWSSPSVFNGSPVEVQSDIVAMIELAGQAVSADPSSVYANFWEVVNSPTWSGVLALNGSIQLQDLPAAIRALLGGMIDDEGNSLIDDFYAHHIGVQINDTQDSSTPALSQSSLFGLVDYELETSSVRKARASAEGGLDVSYNYQVQYLRVLFLNSSLNEFDCKINLTINDLFDTDVTEDSGGGEGEDGDAGNVVVISGSYQAQATSDPSALGVYSFVTEGTFDFTFGENPYLDTITLTKLQFSAQSDTPSGEPDTSTITAEFAIWGSLVFKELDVLDIFSFEQLTFAGLSIGVTFDLTVPSDGSSPTVSRSQLSFQPGDLRLDLAESPPREGDTSLLSLLPFKLSSFLYSQNADQTLESLDYVALTSIPGLGSIADTFNYAFIFDLDLGALGGLVGSLSAFKFSAIIGWLSDGGIAFGIQLPAANGKLEISIEGVLTLSIGEFQLEYQEVASSGTNILSLVLFQSYMEILGTRLPPSGYIDFALFSPISNPDQIGWIVAYDNTGGGDETAGSRGPLPRALNAAGEGESSAFELLYLGLGQRVGPAPADTPTTFEGFLEFMTTDFQAAVTSHDYDSIYQPTGGWLAVGDMKLLDVIQLGFVFYDTTPFYSLTLNVEDLFDFEITYTKVSDSIGMFFANLSLPDSLRTFQVGVASLTLPSLGITVYTNGDWKVDVGFPANDDWSRAFQVQAQAGPVPITGAGGFYLASLSSATDPNLFQNTYPSILAFGFGARLGVGKDFTSGPLKAGISVTFFGIIEGAAGYLSSGSVTGFQQPNALSLKGQFGIIGQIYGSVDFKIIKASVNVTLQASIGIELLLEQNTANDGSILLYVEASISVSVKVSIDLGLFSVSVSFSFDLTVRFDWQLTGSGQTLAAPRVLAARQRRRERLLGAAQATALYPGLPTALPLLFLPEISVVFPDTTSVGAPWFVCSLGIPYADAPPANPSYAEFQPFEAVATQLTTWALITVLELAAYNSSVTQDELSDLDGDPTTLVGWIDYPSVLGQLQVFAAIITVPIDTGTQQYATSFAMPPFLTLSTNGRSSELDYQFSSMNPVSSDYIDNVLQAYFNQLYVNQTQSTSAPQALADTTTPLVEAVFLDYFTGLIRGTVHALLQTMQDGDLTSSPLDALFQKAVGTGQLKTLAGQTSSYFRGGARLPYSSGMTLPTGPAASGTNSLYGLLWQEFPVGPNTAFTINLANADATQTWLACSVSYALQGAAVAPYQGLTVSALDQPGPASRMPYLNTGAQSFAFQNATTWTSSTATQSLRGFPSSLVSVQQQQGTAPVNVIVASRATGAAYLPGGTALPTTQFGWATEVTLSVKQVPGTEPGQPLANTFSIAGASQQDQLLLEQIIESAISQITSVMVLYQASAGAVGLNSAAIEPNGQVFLLRTNTTTVSAPPSGGMTLRAAAPVPDSVPVGASISDVKAFLQILEQAAVTNAPGYYLYYVDSDGNTLPNALFTGGAAPLTILISYQASTSNGCGAPTQIEPYYNAIVVSDADPALLYYAVTTDTALNTQYPALAAGAVSVQLTRDNDSARLAAPASLSAATAAHPALERRAKHTPAELQRALFEAGVTHEPDMRRLLAEAGAAPVQLNALYSVLTYQAGSSSGGSGYITSNLSSPIQPQTPAAEVSCPVGDPPPPDSTSNDTYVVSVPLGNIASANQPLEPNVTPNPYASLNLPYSVSFFLTDVFGNQVPCAGAFSDNNLYFDGLIAVDQWQGVLATYDFGSSPAPSTLVVSLSPSLAAFPEDMSSDQVSSAITLYQGVLNQLTALDAVTQASTVSFYVETNLALDSDSNMVQVDLTESEGAAIVGMVQGLVAYLNGRAVGPAAPFPAGVELPVVVSGEGELPAVFEILVTLGIQRDPSLVVPEVLASYPPAQNVSSTVTPAAGQSSAVLSSFATAFRASFPSLVMSVAMTGVTSAQDTTSAGRARKRLRAQGSAGDGTGNTSAGPQSLWAVQSTLTNITIGPSAGTPFYVSPTPLSNALQTGTVPLPTLPSVLGITLPATRLFTDLDLDLLNEAFFQAVDTLLDPAAATAGFQAAEAAYTTIAQGREQIAQGYSANEVDWLFSADSPFQGSQADLESGQEALEQQMRATLMSAYSIDTIVEYTVAWNSAVPESVSDQVSLFGQVAPTATSPVQVQDGYTFSSSEIAVQSSGVGLFTFLFGALNVADVPSIVTASLSYTITHVEHFLLPASDTPADQARPSMWLQLVNPVVISVSTSGSTPIPVVFRQYPTLPSLMSQTWTAGVASPNSTRASSNPLATAGAWYLDFEYQAQLTAHDQILASVTYNTDLNTSSEGARRALADGPQVFALWEALARFSAVYAAIQPILQQLPADPANASDPATVRWAAALSSFASCVTDVVNNSDWNPTNTAFKASRLQHVVDDYTITDIPGPNSQRTIELVWSASQGESTFPGVTLGILGIAPGGTPYGNQIQGTVSNGITDTYTPTSPVLNNWVQHQIEVDGLSVLVQENAVAALQIERNAIVLTAGTASYTVQPEYIYTTPVVSFSQPVTPFVENDSPIDITTLPNQGTAPNPPCVDPSADSLCQRIYTMLYDLLFDPSAATALRTAHERASVDAELVRRMKLQATFEYPIASGTGGTLGAEPIMVTTPVALARSFNIDVTTTAQLDDLVSTLTSAIAQWAEERGIVFGPAAVPAGAQLVFDITLYAELSGTNTPVLRLSNLYVNSSDIAPLSPSETAAR